MSLTGGAESHEPVSRPGGRRTMARWERERHPVGWLDRQPFLGALNPKAGSGPNEDPAVPRRRLNRLPLAITSAAG